MKLLRSLLISTMVVFVGAMYVHATEYNWDGFYLLEKTDVYNGPTAEAPPGFEQRFDDIAFEIRRGMVYLSNGCGSYGEQVNVSIEEFFEKVFYTETPADLKARFMRKFNVDLPDRLTVWRLPWCENPHADLLLLPEKVFLVDEGLFYGAYKKVGAKEYLQATGLEMCPEGNTYTLEMGGMMQYVFYDWTLEQVYADMLQRYPDEAKHLRKEPPPAGTEYADDFDSEEVWIKYLYHDTDAARNLAVEIEYSNGAIFFEIVEYDDVCLAYVTHWAG